MTSQQIEDFVEVNVHFTYKPYTVQIFSLFGYWKQNEQTYQWRVQDFWRGAADLIEQ